MKQKLFCVLIFLLSTGFVLYSQSQQTLKTIKLTNGISFNGYVEPQNSGGYKITTADGDVFIYSSQDVESIIEVGANKNRRSTGLGLNLRDAAENATRNTNVPTNGLSYREYKNYYTPRDYRPSANDRYNVLGVGLLSWFIPGVGNFMVGDTGTGILCSLLFGASLGAAIYGITEREDIIGAAVIGNLLASIVSCSSAVRRAKRMNMYYQDMAGLASVQVDLKPMLTLNSAPYSPNNLTPVAGFSLSVQF